MKNHIAILTAFFLSLIVYGQFAFNISSPIPADNQLRCVFKNNLIYISIILPTNDSLNFYTDTGGKNFLYKSGRRKLGIKNTKGNLWKKSELEKTFIKNDIPSIEEIYYDNEKKIFEDGMLGREWFAKRIWRINYKDNLFLEKKNFPTNESQLLTSLNFLKDSTRTVVNHLPRVKVIIEGDTLSVLLDTGAQVYLSPGAQEQMNEQPLIAASFISSDIFDKWKLLNPEWKIISKGDRKYKEDIIRVPEIKIGDKIIGPVWFVKRNKTNFLVMSRLFMDREIIGALGGNALSLLGDITIDYKGENLYINK